MTLRGEDSGAQLSRALVDRLGERLGERLERAVSERLVLLEPGERPPHDAETESWVVGALLDRIVELADLSPLCPQHFAVPWVRTAIEVLATPGSGLPEVRARLTELGYPATAYTELQSVADCSPIVPVEVVRQWSTRLVELWRRRELIRVCHRVAAGLAVDVMDFDAAVAELRSAVVGARG